MRRTKGGLDTKLQAVTDKNGRLLSFFMTAAPGSDYTCAAALRDSLPVSPWMQAECGYDVRWFRDTSGKTLHSWPEILQQIHQIRQEKSKRRTRIEIVFGRLKDWQRVATRYDRCPIVFFSALCLAATVMFLLRSLRLICLS